MWLDPVLLLGLALCAGATFVVAPLAAALGTLGVGVLLWSRSSWRLRALLLLCLGLSALRAQHRLAAFDRERAQVRDAFGPPQRCALHGEVDASPTWQRDRASFTLRVAEADCESAQVQPGTRVRLGGGPSDLRRGDRLFVVAQLAPIELLFNQDLPSPLPGAARRGITLSGSNLSVERERTAVDLAAQIDRARAAVRQRILATFAPSVQAMARALVLGENDLDPEDDAAFRRSGLSHMLAVSGTHLVFAVVSLVQALRALLLRFRWLSAAHDCGRFAAAAGIVLSLLYADFAGGSGSAWRAAYMLSAALLGRALGREACPSRALALSLLLGWALDPLVAFDISFLLSAAATSGLMLFGEAFQKPLERLPSKFGRWVGAAIATTLAAMLPCAPLLALLSSELTLAGIFANVIAAPLGETIALPLCLAHAIASPIPPLEYGMGLTASGALWLVRTIAHESAAQTWLAIPVPAPSGYHLALCAPLAAALVLGRGAVARAPRWRFWLVCTVLALGCVELAAQRRGRPKNELRMTALAVGQGDSSLLDLPDGTLLLIDGGGAPEGGADPGERVVLPALRSRRRTHVDVVVLTHPHPDHFGGLVAVLRELSVGELWDTGQGEAHGAGPVYAELLRLAKERGVAIRRPASLCREPHRYGEAVLRLLSPCPNYAENHGANDNSLVFRVDYRQRSFLFTGDAEAIAEKELLASSRAELRADVLKIGHHGSRTSTGRELLAAVAPRVATISCGTRNRFGHPTPEVLGRLAEFGIPAFRTDRDGAIVLSSDGSGLSAQPSYVDAGPLAGWF